MRPSSTRPSTLPSTLTSFVGRQHDKAEVRRLLASSRLVTLTGVAGCGKTRLALQVAAEVRHHYADGVHWIDLARLDDPVLVPQAVAAVLHVREQPGRRTVDGLLDALQGKHLLIVLDNCEHVLRSCCALVASLQEATEIGVLGTSREPLCAVGETRYPLSPMALPPLTLPAEDMERFDAVHLFVERARAVLPAFALTDENAAATATICHRLDGLPLAIELASARVPVLSLDQIAARLYDRFRLLDAASPLTHSHHRTLRAAIDWSYDLLSAAEQVLLRRLSVFSGGCRLDTVEAVCAGDGVERDQVLEVLSSLVNKSLVGAETLQRGEARYSLLETIREYAQEHLRDTGEDVAMHDRHLRCFLHLTEEAAPRLTGTYQHQWLDWLEDEYDNIRAALSWSLERGRIESGLRIAIAVYQFWTIRDYAQEGLSWLERLLPRAGETVSPLIRSNALAYASFLAGFRGNTAAQTRYGREAAVLAETDGDAGKRVLAWALAAQGYAARAEGDYQTEFRLAKREMQLYRELGDTYLLGVTLSTTSFTAMSLGELDAARAMLDEALPLLRETGDPYRIAMALNFSGDLARCERRHAEARSAYEESIALLRELEAVRDLASALHNLGHTSLHLGNAWRAQDLFREAIALHQAQRNTLGFAECLIGFAALAVAGDLPTAGARLLAAARAIGGERVAATWPATQVEYERCLALVQASLTEAELRAAFEAGSRFSLEQAATYARDLSLKAAARQRARKAPGALTVRELEVAALIAEGKSNAEIAAALFVSKRTIEKHIANILSSLGFSNRAQIVRWAIEAGLVTTTD